MQSTVFDSDGKNSFQQVFQPYLGGFGALTQAYEPLLKGLARWQLEVLTLSSRRAQAYLEMPSRLAQCRTPQDLAGEQMHFLQTAYQQYTECAQRGLLALTQLGSPASGAVAAEAPHERDYMTVSETKETATPPRFTERERKVA